MIQQLEKIEETITESSIWVAVKSFLSQHMDFGNVSISILDVLIVTTAIFLTTVVLRVFLKIVICSGSLN